MTEDSDTHGDSELDALCFRALQEWGEAAQRQMVMEELGELTAAINQYHRGRIEKDELAGEIADVYICLRQLEMMLGDEAVVRALSRKMDALDEKLPDEQV